MRTNPEAAECVNPEWREPAGKCGRQVEMQLAKGHFQAAIRSVEDAINELMLPRRPAATIGVAEIYSQEIANLLESQFGVIYLADMDRVPFEKILAIPQVGPKRVEAIIKGLLGVIARHG
jgi:hypothetical protein